MPQAAPLHAPVTLSEYDGVRSLHLGTPWIQGSMRIAKPERIELDYVQRMLASLLWLPSAEWGRGHAVQLGLGAGAITRFTRHALRMRTTAVELNLAVILAGRAYFKLGADDALLSVLEADAAVWVREPAHHDSAQLLHVDLYDHEAAAPVLDDDAFYAWCRVVLATGGVMSVNLFGRRCSFARSAARIAAVFGPEQVFSLRPTREGNTVLIAGKDVRVPDAATLKSRATLIEARFLPLGLAARKWLRMLRPYQAPGA